MVVVSYSGKEINAKLVYYGPGLSGKTTNLEHVYESVPSNSRGKMVSMKTRTERTLFFDFLPVDLGELGGFKTRFLLYTVPGQVYYNATRKLVLRGVDAIIFVADSGRGKMGENIDSLQNLMDNLKEYGLSIDEIPIVLQYNKRDLPDVYTKEELDEALNKEGWPTFDAVATTGEGVFETFRGIAKILLAKLSKEVKLDAKPAKSGPASARPAPAQSAAPAPRPVPAPPVAQSPAAPAVSSGDPAASPKQPFRLGAKPPAAPARPSAPEPVEARDPAPPVTGAPRTTPDGVPTPVSPGPVQSVRATPPTPEPSVLGELFEDRSGSSPSGVSAGGEPTAPTGMETPEIRENRIGSKLKGRKEKVRDRDKAKGKPAEVDPLEVAYQEAQERKRKEISYRTESPEGTSPAGETRPKARFWGRLFGAKPKVEGVEAPAPEVVAEVDAVPYQGETRVASVDIPSVAANGVENPVVIERRVQVPITLGPEEVLRGARLRLVMEIRVAASQPVTNDKDVSKVA